MDTKDEATNLTPREKEAIRSSFAHVHRDWEKAEFGKDLFILLFKRYPNTQGYFRHLKNLPLEEVRSSKQLETHLFNFKYQLVAWVENLDDAVVLVGLLQRIATSHFKRGISPDMFEGAFACFKTLLIEKYQPNEFTLQSWDAAVGTILAVISGKMKELQTDENA